MPGAQSLFSRQVNPSGELCFVTVIEVFGTRRWVLMRSRLPGKGLGGGLARTRQNQSCRRYAAREQIVGRAVQVGASEDSTSRSTTSRACDITVGVEMRLALRFLCQSHCFVAIHQGA